MGLLSQLIFLKNLGFYLQEDWRAPDKFNQEGYGESKRLEEINLKILDVLGGSQSEMPRFARNWEKNPKLIPVRNEVRDFISEMNSHGDWALKGTLLTITFQFWEQLLPKNHSCLLCIRSPLAVIRSKKNAFRDTEELGARDWFNRNARMIRDTSEQRRMLVFYEDYYSVNSNQVERIADFVGKDSTQMARRPTESLRHFYFSVDDNMKSPDIASITKYLYALLLLSKDIPLAINWIQETVDYSLDDNPEDADPLVLQDLETKLFAYKKIINHPYVKLGLKAKSILRKIRLSH